MKKKSRLPVIALACAAVLIIGLALALMPDNGGSPDGKADTSATANASKIQENVFPKDKVIDVKITIDENDFQSMLDNAAAEELKTASVDYNGIHYDNIGIRTKGNLSLRSVVNSESDRYSFKLSFDEYLSNQTLYGIGKINLNNNYSDATYMREFMTYELAEQMGLPVPGYSFVNVYVNDKLWGFYLAVEQIGDAYLERNFGDSSGALYKAEMNGNGGDLKWQDSSLSSYPALVQKSASSGGDALIRMLDELNNGTDYENVLDVEEALKYIALNTVTSNMDSYLGSNKQNYYLYENKGVFSVLPWDYNMAFGGFGGSQIYIDEPTQGAVTERPLIAKLLAVDKYKEKYHDIIRSALQGYLAPDAFTARAQEIADMISASVKQDPRPFYTYDQFRSGIQTLTAFNATYSGTVTQQLDGKAASTNNGSGSGGGMGGGMGGGRGGRGAAGAQGGQQALQPQAGAQGGQQALQPQAGAQGGQQALQPQAGAQGGQQGMGPGPGGFGGGQGGMGPPGGMGGGMGGPGGFGGQAAPGAATPQGSAAEALATLIALAVLALACLFVATFKKKRI
ncbi:CotH kinase family protein [Paenibacillus sp. MBLB4367]|uniref:CotH kinase family protein n=1 Tax=Paenibacillus sp. MBLB4367 TaxID=3384767 RepID=UPI0039083F99